MKLLQSSFIIFGLFFLTGCKKYLSEEPTKQTSIQTVSQLEALLDNAYNFVAEKNSTTVFSTDDFEITREAYQKNPGSFYVQDLQFYVFQTNELINTQTDPLWTGEYQKIFMANLILTYVDKVTGDQATKDRVKADAYFMRAYSNWVLVNNYCAPYSAGNLSSPGLPLKKTMDYAESGKRASLKETYDFILSDIAEAQKGAPEEIEARRAWRISQKAISAFLSRFYLFTGDYNSSLTEANKALTSHMAQLVDFNTLTPGTTRTFINPAATLQYINLNSWSFDQFLYWPEFYYTRYTYNPANWFIPSRSLIALYDTANDLRYKDFVIPNGGRRHSIIDPVTFDYTIFNNASYVPAGFTVAEVLLNKAEALARNGDAGAAMDAANMLRVKRMVAGHYIPLTAADKDEAIKKVLEERRRELPFAMRWYDIRRFSVNDYPADDITVTKDFFNVTATGVDVNSPKTYTLTPKRYLIPINGAEITASRGELTQNPY